MMAILLLHHIWESHHEDNNDKTMRQQQHGGGGMMGQEMMFSSDNHHHMSFRGMCAPGFAPLDAMCVLDDRCGPGAYPGKVCMMDWCHENPISNPSNKKMQGYQLIILFVLRENT